jgi:Fe-Mn family superoxide dismutase
MQMSKRKFIKTAVLSFIGLVTACKNNNLSNYKINLNQPTQGANMTFELPALPYSKNALAPHISENTINFHYGKHHQTYVTNLNNLLKDTDLIGKSLEEVIKISAVDKTKAGIFNNSAQVWNHTFYWHSMKPNGGGKPTGEILTKIEADFGSYENFVTEFKNAGTTQFGSGWAWLVLDNDKLKVIKTGNAETPLTTSVTPLLTMDVWEHAYYLDFQNARPTYIDTFLNHLVNWDFAKNNMLNNLKNA